MPLITEEQIDYFTLQTVWKWCNKEKMHYENDAKLIWQSHMQNQKIVKTLQALKDNTNLLKEL